MRVHAGPGDLGIVHYLLAHWTIGFGLCMADNRLCVDAAAGASVVCSEPEVKMEK
jgi:hypothetical protein